MASAVAFIRWENYCGSFEGPGLFSSDVLTYSSSQERLHSLSAGDRLWLVSRCVDDRQYYFVGYLWISRIYQNAEGTALEQKFGRFGLVADRARSHDLGRRFPAEGLMRSLQFETGAPIRFGASLGQSIQCIRFLTVADEELLYAGLARILAGEDRFLDFPFGLWTKCESVFADYFLANWQARREPLAFLLYDSPPVLTPGAPVFIHSDKNLRLLATFCEAQFVAGHKYTVEPAERLAERERIWVAYRAGTFDPPPKSEFDSFWERQNGVRSLFIMENVHSIRRPCPFKSYGRALEWGYPIGVGYRYVSLSQSALLLRHAQVPPELNELYLRGVLKN